MWTARHRRRPALRRSLSHEDDIPVRGDFDSLDNPFYCTSDPTADHYSKKPAAGSQFIM
jgi:hypothetical protein